MATVGDARPDHDQRLKGLLQVFFGEFLQMFFAAWHERLDAAAVRWLTQEAFLSPPAGRRRTIDLVGEAPVRPGYGAPAGERWTVIVVCEIESDGSTQPVRVRLAEEFMALRLKHGPRVLPLALFLKVGLAGVGAETYREPLLDTGYSPLTLEFLYVGLPALEAAAYVQADNPLGWALAALMRVAPGGAAAVGAQALRRIADAGLDDARKHLLAECVQAYLPLGPEGLVELARAIQAPGWEGVRAMNITWTEQARSDGLFQGRVEGQRELLRTQLQTRFGELPAAALAGLEAMTDRQLLELGGRLLTASSLAELGLSSN